MNLTGMPKAPNSSLSTMCACLPRASRMATAALDSRDGNVADLFSIREGGPPQGPVQVAPPAGFMVLQGSLQPVAVGTDLYGVVR